MQGESPGSCHDRLHRHHGLLRPADCTAVSVLVSANERIEEMARGPATAHHDHTPYHHGITVAGPVCRRPVHGGGSGIRGWVVDGSSGHHKPYLADHIGYRISVLLFRLAHVQRGRLYDDM